MQNSVAQMPNSAPQMSNFESIQVDPSTLVTTIRSAVNFYTRNVDKIKFLLFDFQLARMLDSILTALFKAQIPAAAERLKKFPDVSNRSTEESFGSYQTPNSSLERKLIKVSGF